MKKLTKTIIFISLFIVINLSLAGLNLYSQIEETTKIGNISLVSGYVEVTADDETERIRFGRHVYENDEFFVDEDSTLMIKFDNGCEIKAEGPAEFIIEENMTDEENTEPLFITQIKGIIDVDFDNNGDGEVYISSPSLSAGVRGTKFTVIVADDGASYLGVEEGSVAVTSVNEDQKDIDNIDINENNYDTDFENDLDLDTNEILVEPNQEIEADMGEDIKDFKLAKLTDLKEMKKVFIAKRRELIINDFPTFAKRIKKSFIKVPIFIKFTQKRFKLYMKGIEIINKVEKKIITGRLSRNAKKKALKKLEEKKKTLLKSAVKFIKKTMYHSNKIKASFRVMKNLPKILKGTNITETDDYIELKAEFSNVMKSMDDFLRDFYVLSFAIKESLK